MQYDDNGEPSEVAKTTEPAETIELHDFESTETLEPVSIFTD